MIVIIVLMCTISLEFQLAPCVTIQNQCSNFKLESPIYFGNGAVCPKLSGQQIDISTRMNASFEINATEDDFEGALLFKLQRCTDSQRNMNASITGTDKNETAHIYMLVAWKVKDAKPFVRVVLVKHTKEFTWNEDKLRKFCDKNCSWLKKYDNIISDTWFMGDNMMLKTSFKARDLESNFELSISIFEEEKEDYTIRPFCIDFRR
jgi:hypothetical protein